MRIEELSFYEEFWVVLYKLILSKKGWTLEIIDNYRGWIIKGKENIACFSCSRERDNEAIRIAIKSRKYYDEVVTMIQQCESDIVSMNLKNFKTELVVMKDWEVAEVLDEVNPLGKKRGIRSSKGNPEEEM